MKRGNVKLKNPERFLGEHKIAPQKIKKAIDKAGEKLWGKADIYREGFPKTTSENFRYPITENNNWCCGMHTGTFTLMYMLTGDRKFLDITKEHIKTYRRRIDEKINLADHDIGFVFSPSCVLYNTLTGDEEAKNIALKAAELLYDEGYSEKGGFILRAGTRAKEEWACRTMMDSLLNAPLLLWAGEQTGEEKYKRAGFAQSVITDKCLARDDGSTFHHYQFDVLTHKPVRGLTLQGNSDNSCWSRGHAWGILGLPIAYEYTKEEWLLKLHRDLTYFMLNHLPEDNIPYWDFDFVSGDEARDSSAGVISACGLLLAASFLPEDSIEKQIYKNAAGKMLEAVIDNCTKSPDEYDGLIKRVTGSKPHGMGVDECALYGDYFYLEAILRYQNPKIKLGW